MRIDILTLFPKMFAGPFEESIVKRAKDKGLVEIYIHDLRKWAKDKRGTVDDRPYGGGIGMILTVEPIDKALQELKGQQSKTILLTPQGQTFKQEKAQALAKQKHLILITGHYEGFDERIRSLVDEELSIGDFILTGGELPAMVVVDTITRLIPKVLDQEAIEKESFSTNLLEYPQYTRPENYKGYKVPEILLSGNHAEINQWRKQKAIEKTNAKRPDLLDR